MNRQEAEEALGIIRKVIQNTHEDLVAHNWGMIWMVHAVTNMLGFFAVGHFVEGKGLSLPWYLVPLGGVAVVNAVVILLLAERDRGVRSFVEGQLHGIWVTFIIFSIAGAGFLHLAGGPSTLFAPLMALTSGIGFAMMGVVFDRRFLVFGALFLVLATLMPLFVALQWFALGVAWFAALFSAGSSMHRERIRRKRDGTASEIL